MMSMLMAAGSLPYGTAVYGGELELVAESAGSAFQEGDQVSDDGVYEIEVSYDMEATDKGNGFLMGESEIETEQVTGLETEPDEENAGEALETVPDSVIISEEVFPDGYFRSYVEEHCDMDGDGILSRAEIDSVTEISVPSLSISSLQGIECFTQLETLDCSSNQLTSLDLSELSYLK